MFTVDDLISVQSRSIQRLLWKRTSLLAPHIMLTCQNCDNDDRKWVFVIRTDWILCSNANVHSCLDFLIFLFWFVTCYDYTYDPEIVEHVIPRVQFLLSYATAFAMSPSNACLSEWCMCDASPVLPQDCLPFFRAGKPRYGMNLLVNSCFKVLEHLNQSLIWQPYFSLRSGCTDLTHYINSHICWWTALTLQSGSTCICCSCLTLITMTSPRGWWGPKQTSCRCWWHRTKEWFHLTTLYNSGVGQEAQLHKNVSLHVDIGCKEKEGGGLVDC